MPKMKMEQMMALVGNDKDVQTIIFTLANASRRISKLLRDVNRQHAGRTNSSGDEQLALDIEADKILFQLFTNAQLVKEYATEERETIVPVNSCAIYSVTVDPLDGSSLLDVNLSVGTILGIWKGTVMEGTLIGAAYVVYGPTTILVFCTDNDVHECLVEQTGLRLLQTSLRLTEKGSIYSIGGLRNKWTPEHLSYIHALEENGYKLRYSGGFVPDMHQILLKKGGVFSYPALVDNNTGKLRLMFELCPFAFITEHAGGIATDGRQRILDIPRITLHQRSPIYIGSKEEVTLAQHYS